MQLDVYNTHMELYPYKKDDYPIIEDMFTAIDKMSGDEGCRRVDFSGSHVFA